MRPSETFTQVMQLTRRYLSFCGADIIDKSYKLNSRTYLVVGLIISYFVFSGYTIKLKFSENSTIVLETFCMVGSVLQGISKLVSVVIYKQHIQFQFDFLHSIYLEYEDKGVMYLVVLKKFVSRVRLVIKGVGYLYVSAYVIATIMPPIIWVLTTRHLFVMQYFIPTVDADTTLGYFITIAVQAVNMFFGAFGNCAGDMLMLLCFTHSILIADIFELKTKELNESAIDFGSRRSANNLQTVLDWHQEYNRYIERCDTIFFWINFTQICTSGMNIVLTLIIVFTGNWPGSYGYIALSFCMLYLYCGIGTLVEFTNERLTQEIYAIHWYYLTVSQQNDVRFMLMKSYSPTIITVGGVFPLSVNTGLKVTKTVYSVFMMLLNYFG